jgi:transcriptional regulator with XRE-family HTH domain
MLFVSGGELSALRREQGLSQPDLAELTGLHRNTIANVERGRGDSSVLAMSLMQVYLRASGVVVGNEGFILCPPPAGDRKYPYPSLMVRAPSMISTMGQLTRERRRKREMSLTELADAAGVHRNTIWNFERGLVAPSVSTIYSIYRSLEVRWVGGSDNGLLFL